MSPKHAQTCPPNGWILMAGYMMGEFFGWDPRGFSRGSSSGIQGVFPAGAEATRLRVTMDANANSDNARGTIADVSCKATVKKPKAKLFPDGRPSATRLRNESGSIVVNVMATTTETNGNEEQTPETANDAISSCTAASSSGSDSNVFRRILARLTGVSNNCNASGHEYLRRMQRSRQ